MLNSLQGFLVASSPATTDVDDARMVVLVLRHDETGAIGVILNKPITLPDASSGSTGQLSVGLDPNQVPSLAGSPRVHFGGPVPAPVLAVHKAKRLGEFELHPGVYVATKQSHLKRLLKQNRYPFRLFLGHKGWGRRQLEDEVRRGIWLTIPATDRYIFGEDERLWGHVVGQAGWLALQSMLRTRHFLIEPSPN